MLVRKIEEAVNKEIPRLSSQLEQKALQSDLLVERNRITNLATLTQGSTTGDAELMDGRVGADGVTYTNIGNAMRGQFSTANDNMKNIVGEDIKYTLNWLDGGYISNTDGSLVSYSGWKYTDFIVIGQYTRKIICKTTLKGSYSYNAFYDKNKNFISNFSVNNSTLEIPVNAYYLRVSVTTNADTIIYKVFESLINKCNSNDVLKLSQDLDNTIINNYLGVKVDYPINWLDGGYINNTDGSFISYSGWQYTDFIQLDDGIVQLEIETTLTGSYSYNAFYDTNKNFISTLVVSNKLVNKPTNAKYIRLSVNTGKITKIKNKIHKLIEKCTLNEVKDLISGSDSIITLNKDVEPFLIQASEGLGQMFTNKTKPLVFTHFSDVHTRQELWNRIIEYNNKYSSYINFSIHTGDYCGGSQLSYIDLYANGLTCNIPLYNCVGNHDTYLDNAGTRGTKQKTKELLFNHMTNWNVTFMDISNSMTYYKDFNDNKIRLIVLDYYFDIDVQCTWLLDRLNETKTLGYHVITCMHEMTNIIINKLDTPFQTLDNFESLGGNKYSISKFDKVIGDWVKTGGIHIANFAGHEHSDFIGYTDNGVLNICVQSATDNVIWTDGKRVQGTRTWDCFNVVAVDVATNNLKLIRIGNNSDHYLREKKVLSYDYINKRIIAN